MFEKVELASNITLYRGDCSRVLPTINRGEVDGVITDPPFGINFKYNQHNDTPEGYGQWLWNIIEQAESKCTPGAPVFVWQAMPNCRHFSEWFPCDYRIFAACKNFVQMRPAVMQYAYDPVIVWWTDGNEKPYCAGNASRDWHIGNTANTLNRKAGDAGNHPCARPLDQVTHIVNQWIKPGGTVLDVFMGSGTTCVSCVQTGRGFIGIEIDKEYFDFAVKRISKTLEQPRLFNQNAEQLRMEEA